MPSVPRQYTIETLRGTFPRAGEVTWIAVRAGHRTPVEVVQSVAADTEGGLLGDHFNSRRSSVRQVTLLQAEHLPVIASFLGKVAVDPRLLRRNIAVRGINLIALADRRFQVGEVVLEGTGRCHPCSRMEENLGPGGYNALRGHGGITARIIRGGIVRLGDQVIPAPVRVRPGGDKRSGFD